MMNVFIDFDGTISLQDVGDAMFERFGGARSAEAIKDYRESKISAVECFHRECNACGEVDKTELNAFLDAQKIDPTFKPFIEFCSQSSLVPYIVSDGMSYYIDRILNNYGIQGVKVFSNKLELVPVRGTSIVRFQPSFPFTDEVCDRCANCKRNHMLTISAEEDILVYIGEGYSDRCPARFADIIFAKDELLLYCQQENISYYEYKTFADVQNRLQSLIEKKSSQKRPHLHKRRQAELARREIYMGG
jgi:2,3-diketo-5-methylthio-1-phosphopentane phosphatase